MQMPQQMQVHLISSSGIDLKLAEDAGNCNVPACGRRPN